MKPEDKQSSRWLRSSAYLKAKAAVKRSINSRKKMLGLIERATRKTQSASSGPISKIIDSVKVLTRLISAYVKGDYRAVSFENISLIVAAMVYFVMPLDALPDFIAILGLTDDAAVLAWTWAAVKEEVEAFLRWELEQQPLKEIHNDEPRNHEPHI